MIPVAATRALSPYREGLASPLGTGGFDPTDPEEDWGRVIDLVERYVDLGLGRVEA